MSRVAFILAVCLLAALAEDRSFAGTDLSVDAPTISCGNGVPGGIHCLASKKDRKAAVNAYTRGLKLNNHKHLEEAFLQFDEAARLVPQDANFLAAREGTKAQLVFQHTERGDALLADAQREQAAAENRAALNLDPDNSYTQERLAEAVRDPAARAFSGMAAMVADSTEIHLQPKTERATFHYR